jgi:hypothetical protein
MLVRVPERTHECPRLTLFAFSIFGAVFGVMAIIAIIGTLVTCYSCFWCPLAQRRRCQAIAATVNMVGFPAPPTVSHVPQPPNGVAMCGPVPYGSVQHGLNSFGPEPYGPSQSGCASYGPAQYSPMTYHPHQQFPPPYDSAFRGPVGGPGPFPTASTSVSGSFK